MKELDYIKLFFEKQFAKYDGLELGFKYEFNSNTRIHIIEVSNEEIFKSKDFSSEAFDFSLDFSDIFNELMMFVIPSDLIKIGCIDYSENNFVKKFDYLLRSKNFKSLISTIVIEDINDVSYLQGEPSGVNKNYALAA